MSKKPCLPLDGAKLFAHLKVRGLKESQVAQELGYGQAYISNCVIRGRIGKDFAMLLEHIYGITPDMYSPAKPFTLMDTPKAPVIDTERLAVTIAEEVFKRLAQMQMTLRFGEKE